MDDVAARGQRAEVDFLDRLGVAPYLRLGNEFLVMAGRTPKGRATIETVLWPPPIESD